MNFAESKPNLTTPEMAARIVNWIFLFLAGAISAFSFLKGNPQAGAWAALAALCKLEAIFWHGELKFEMLRFAQFRESILQSEENIRRQDGSDGSVSSNSQGNNP